MDAHHRLETRIGRLDAAAVVAVDAQPVHSRPMMTCSLPTMGILFSAWQATTQALQPMQAVWSMTIPHAFSVPSYFG